MAPTLYRLRGVRLSAQEIAALTWAYQAELEAPQHPSDRGWDGVHLDRTTPQLDRILARIPARPRRVLVWRLAAGAERDWHTDQRPRFAGDAAGMIGLGEDQVLPVHIPLATNPGCTTEVRELPGPIHLERGQAYALLVSQPHRVANAGRTIRYHLLVDAEVSPALRDLLEPVAVTPQGRACQ